VCCRQELHGRAACYHICSMHCPMLVGCCQRKLLMHVGASRDSRCPQAWPLKGCYLLFLLVVSLALCSVSSTSDSRSLQPVSAL